MSDITDTLRASIRRETLRRLTRLRLTPDQVEAQSHETANEHGVTDHERQAVRLGVWKVKYRMLWQEVRRLLEAVE